MGKKKSKQEDNTATTAIPASNTTSTESAMSTTSTTSTIGNTSTTISTGTIDATEQEAIDALVDKALKAVKGIVNDANYDQRKALQPILNELLYQAAESGNLLGIRSFIEWGNSVGVDLVYVASLQENWTPLLRAVQGGHVDVVRCIVNDLGADVNQEIEDGWTPLCIATDSEDLDMMRFLCKELGADVNLAMEDGNGWTPLHLAIYGGKIYAVRCLCKDLGADVNRTMEGGWTPLILALTVKPHATISFEEDFDLVRSLIREFGADVSQAQIYDGLTPLMCAAYSHQELLLKCLVHRGADVRATSTAGRTATDYWRQAGASATQIVYLEVRAHCANPACEGPGRKRCARCKQARFCSEECIHAHWPVHKFECEVRG
jgi:ankyrin repeat protein